MHAFEGAAQKFGRLLLSVRSQQDQRQLHITGKRGGRGRPDHSQSGEAQLAVDQQPVEHQVYKNSNNARAHGQAIVPGHAKNAHVCVGQRECRQSEEHDVQVFLPLGKRPGQIARTSRIVEESPDQRFGQEGEHRRGQRGKSHAQHEVEAEAGAHAAVVSAAEKLRSEDPRAACPAEQAEVVNEQHLIDDGYAGHGLGAQAADHQVVKQVDKGGYRVLQQKRQRQHRDGTIEFFFSDQFPHWFFHKKAASPNEMPPASFL